MTDIKRLRELLEETQRQGSFQDYLAAVVANNTLIAALPALLDELERLRAENQEQHERIGQLIYESGK